MHVLELFPCSGGLAMGLRRAGIQVDMSFDLDPDACDSYQANLGERPIRIDARDLLRMLRAGWRPPVRVDLVIADPPCTPRSRAGSHEGRDDERDLLDVAVAFIRLLRPLAYLIANVPGLDEGPNWPVVQETIGSLAGDGYCVADYVSLDAADYGVPQHRVRPFWYGHRAGPCIRWPARTHGEPVECCSGTFDGVEPLRPHVTCRDALGHLPPSELGSPVRLRWRSSEEAVDSSRCCGRRVQRPGAEDALLVHPRHPINVADEPSRTVMCRGDGRGAQGSSVLEWPWAEPATPLGHRDATSEAGREPAGPHAIKLSERAAALLQGFPDGWVFAGRTKRSRWSQIGQGVPPPLAEAVARSVLTALRAARRVQVGRRYGERRIAPRGRVAS